ncbi:MAG TPA: DUF2249 domain-containing protein [Candidatus Desulfobacillus sp.]|nr:DUF2249 domain-containing protein [Candidatus Desulfobacillus sp.]
MSTNEPAKEIDTSGIAARAGERVIDTRIDHSNSCANLATAAVAILAVGESFVIVADHDPCGIGYMLKAEQPGQTSWDVLENGPARWQARVTRLAASPAGS